MPLFSALKAKRRELAETAGVPAYIIFNDKTLLRWLRNVPLIWTKWHKLMELELKTRKFWKRIFGSYNWKN